eukprot:CAMPEP_0173161856 /NCGR_PEP_ID=MMETSP1105-20130129/18873_1 /TAXON_ID=2985 /ORGANISM="Ochromonas sp., Strain BG-1" /LENGTH=229 /DNA_ID=CAMNT_0014081399 /DNA_START=618 /DNA_END=1307 /DNA_ORIENTATION=+
MKFQQYGTLLPSDLKGGSNGGDGDDNNANDDDSESIDKIEATGSDSPHTPTSSSSPKRPHSPNPRSRSPSVRSPSPQPSAIQRRAAMHQAVSATTTTTSSNDTKTNQGTNLSARRSSTTNQHAKNSVDFDEFVKEKTSYAVQDNAKKLEQLHVFVLRTLEQERKVSFQKINQLTDVLAKCQQELHDARKEIVELKQKLSVKDENQLEQDNKIISEMNGVLKLLLDHRNF